MLTTTIIALTFVMKGNNWTQNFKRKLQNNIKKRLKKIVVASLPWRKHLHTKNDTINYKK